MVTKEELCKKIEEVFPEAGVCGIDFDVEFDKENRAWVVDLHHGSHHLKTFIDIDEASNCIKGKTCIPLAMQVAQLKRNFKLATSSEH